MSAPETLTRDTLLSTAAPEARWLSEALTTLDAALETPALTLMPIGASADSLRASLALPARKTSLPVLEAVKRRYDDEDEDEEDDDLDGFGEEDEFDDFEDEDDLDDFDDFDDDFEEDEEFEDLEDEDEDEFEDHLAFVVR